MLQLTRRLGQSIVFGTADKPECTRLTVLAMSTCSAEVELATADLKLVATIKQEVKHGFDVDGWRVDLVLLNVQRGEVRLGLSAPQDVSIRRP